MKKNNPRFIGSKKDFKKFLSGYNRNLVQKLSKKHKDKIGRCENCGIVGKQLDSAHIHGKERTKIIESILVKFETSDNNVDVDLIFFEKLFIETHNPIEEVIKILCVECHRKYDRVNKKEKIFRRDKNPNTKNIYNKKNIINVIENHLDCKVDLDNFNFSNINKSGLFTVEPKNNCHLTDWHLCLINKRKKTLNYFIIKSNSLVYEKLYWRKDKERFRLVFEPSDESFTEKLSGEKFQKFLLSKIQLSEEDCL